MEERPKERRTHQAPLPHTPDPRTGGLLVGDVARGAHTPANQNLPTDFLGTYSVLGEGPPWGREDAELSVRLLKSKLRSRGPSPGREMGELVVFAEQISPGGEKLPAECLTHILYLLANIPSLPGPRDRDGDGDAGAKIRGEGGTKGGSWEAPATAGR